jgi:hypothetical protein
LSWIDYFGEFFAYELGITSPKYQYVIDELISIQEEVDAEVRWHDVLHCVFPRRAESVAFASSVPRHLARLCTNVPLIDPCIQRTCSACERDVLDIVKWGSNDVLDFRPKQNERPQRKRRGSNLKRPRPKRKVGLWTMPLIQKMQIFPLKKTIARTRT